MKLLSKVLYAVGLTVVGIGVCTALVVFVPAGWLASKLFGHLPCGVTACPMCRRDS